MDGDGGEAASHSSLSKSLSGTTTAMMKKVRRVKRLFVAKKKKKRSSSNGSGNDKPRRHVTSNGASDARRLEEDLEEMLSVVKGLPPGDASASASVAAMEKKFRQDVLAGAGRARVATCRDALASAAEALKDFVGERVAEESEHLVHFCEDANDGFAQLVADVGAITARAKQASMSLNEAFDALRILPEVSPGELWEKGEEPGKSQQGGGKGKQTAACDNPELTEEQVYPSVFLFAFLHASGQKADVQVPPVELDKMLSVVNGAPSLESVRVLKDAVFREFRHALQVDDFSTMGNCLTLASHFGSLSEYVEAALSRFDSDAMRMINGTFTTHTGTGTGTRPNVPPSSFMMLIAMVFERIDAACKLLLPVIAPDSHSRLLSSLSVWAVGVTRALTNQLAPLFADTSDEKGENGMICFVSLYVHCDEIAQRHPGLTLWPFVENVLQEFGIDTHPKTLTSNLS